MAATGAGYLPSEPGGVKWREMTANVAVGIIALGAATDSDVSLHSPHRIVLGCVSYVLATLRGTP